jgi:hypothetical protein
MRLYFRIDCLLTTEFKNYVAYATSHRAMLKRKKVKELGWVEK